ncbi:MAG: phosphonate C-P lyase system protein PhnG [Thermodesulfobacteriota bacterium]
MVDEMIDQSIRQQWMAVLAKAAVADLEEAWALLREKPDYYFLRPPETGLIMVRARAGGGGDPFNLGETTVTRCTVQVKDGFRGTAYVMGRNRRHAELAALLDALLQDPDQRASLMRFIVDRLNDGIQKRKTITAQKVGSTRVEFFTMVRGDET